MNMIPPVSSERSSSPTTVATEKCGRRGDDSNWRRSRMSEAGRDSEWEAAATRKHHHTLSFKPMQLLSLTLTSRLSLVFLVLASLALEVAAGSGGENGVGHARRNVVDSGPTWELIRAREILVDHEAGALLARRFAAPQAATATSSSSDPPTSTTTSVSVSATPSNAATATVPTVDVLPTPFDTVSLDTNVTENCSQFLSFVVAVQSFKSCLPLSGLLRDSVGFFEIMKKGSFATTAIMDRICGVDVDQCTRVMEAYGSQLRGDSFCGSDYNKQNPVVTNLFTSLVSYRTLFTAGCLKAEDGDYCFVDAVTSTEHPEDLFIYSLPLGSTFPGGSRPTCSDCLERTMQIFSAAAGNQTQPLSDTYVPAAELLNLGCGPGFVNTTIEAFDSAAISTQHLRRLPTIVTVAMAVAATLYLF